MIATTQAPSASGALDGIDEFYRAYGQAFSSGDLDALDAMFDYPYLLTGPDGSREIDDRSVYAALLDELRAAGWAETQILRAAKHRMGADGAILVVAYQRYRRDGAALAGGTAAYFLRRAAEGWKFTGICDGYPG